MSRTIPTTLQLHMNTQSTTLTTLLKVTTVGGVSFGVSGLDADVDYDDGTGVLTYSAAIGYEGSSAQYGSSLAVDNSEATMLIVDTGQVTEQMIEAGTLDFARYWLYRINWADPQPNSHALLQSGTLGETRLRDGLAAVVELRGLAQQLKQSIVDLYSLTCRARFGSQDGETRKPCRFDANSLWANGTVAAPGAEDDLQFTATTAPAVNGPNGALPFVPGLVEFLSGANMGVTREIADVVGTAITLRFPFPNPIAGGDSYRIRPDCAKRYREDCKDKYNNELNNRSEYLIPVSDQSSNATPGASVNIGGGNVDGNPQDLQQQ